MDEISIFQDKAVVPVEKDLVEKLGSTYQLWILLKDFVMSQYPKGLAEWNFPKKKYGTSFRIKDKKRAIIYFLPRDKFFKVAFVFGQKTFDSIMKSNISEEIKSELQKTNKYAEGRRIRIEIKNDSKIQDIKTLVKIKLAN